VPRLTATPRGVDIDGTCILTLTSKDKETRTIANYVEGTGYNSGRDTWKKAGLLPETEVEFAYDGETGHSSTRKQRQEQAAGSAVSASSLTCASFAARSR